LGEDDPRTLTAMANFGLSYGSQGRWEAAVKLDENVLKERIRLLGEEHPETLGTLGWVAVA